MIQEAVKAKSFINNIPEALIYEVLEGKPIFYKNYKEVLNGTKKLDDIMGSSSLQSFILTYIVKQIIKQLDTEDKYWLFISELGTHIKKNDNRACDIALYDIEKSNISIDDIDEHYLDLPPQIVIEVDIKIDLEEISEYQYILRKTNSLHEFGTEKVIWILTHEPSIVVAEKGKTWQIHKFDDTINIIEQCDFNIGKYLKKKGKDLTAKGTKNTDD